MQKGIIICTSTNTYLVEEKEKIYKCLARGKFKKEKISSKMEEIVSAQVVKMYQLEYLDLEENKKYDSET